MPEKLLHYIWQHRLFYPSGMTTTDGDAVEVVNPGTLNLDAGPDFFNAQVRIGTTLWAGNVEIHTRGSDWYAHGHHTDAAYDNVILHVVDSASDRPVTTSKGRSVPEVRLAFPQEIKQRYDELSSFKGYIRCADYIGDIPPLVRHAWIDRLLLEHFELRNSRTEGYLSDFDGDWDQAFFCLLARAMGFSVNADAMEALARCTPVRVLIKHNDPVQMEALLLGQAGLLPDDASGDAYMLTLKREYDFLRVKFGLTPIEASRWKMLRLRPDNFPAVRLSQLAAVVAAVPGNFESVFRSLDVAGMVKRLDVSASEYWNDHYTPCKPSASARQKRLGLWSRRLIVTNAIVPFVFAYARRYGDEHGQRNALSLMQFLPVERNGRLDLWCDLGLKPQSEGDAQALMLLLKNYCMQGKCLLCRFGHEVLSKHQ